MTTGITLAHGDGGAQTEELVREVFTSRFGCGEPPDAAVVGVTHGRLAVTTDGYVVSPPVFPGGDIGCLAVWGTCNDLAMVGARPRWLTASFLLEEGLELDLLRTVAASMASAARTAGVTIAAGDTKVVSRGDLDRLFIVTAGAGEVPPDVDLGYHLVRPGDAVVVSGPVGSHGLTILNARHDLGLGGSLVSDCGCLVDEASALVALPGVRVMRDLTRGGLARALQEVAGGAGVDIELWLDRIPVEPWVQTGCELLGVDPLYLACEGRMLAVVEPACATRAAEVFPAGAIVGKILTGSGSVNLNTGMGMRRLDGVDVVSIPRIC